MKHLKKYMVIGFLFCSIIGTLFHFLYEWLDRNVIVGFFVPVNESIWEHMKLAVFPTLLYLPFLLKLKKKNAYITPALCYGILAATAFLPIFFYTYSGIIGYHIMFLDVLSFYISVAIAFVVTYRLLKSNRTLSICSILLVIVLVGCFFAFTYQQPDLPIFREIS